MVLVLCSLKVCLQRPVVLFLLHGLFFFRSLVPYATRFSHFMFVMAAFEAAEKAELNRRPYSLLHEFGVRSTKFGSRIRLFSWLLPNIRQWLQQDTLMAKTNMMVPLIWSIYRVFIKQVVPFLSQNESWGRHFKTQSSAKLFTGFLKGLTFTLSWGVIFLSF